MTSPLSQFGIIETWWISGCSFLIGVNSSTIYLGLLLFSCLSIVIGINCSSLLVQSIAYTGSNTLVRSIISSLNSRANLKNPIWAPWYLCIISCILFFNLVGLIPYSYTFTSSAVIVSFLSFSTFILINFLGAASHGWGLLHVFLPRGIPVLMAPLLVIIEIFSYFARVVSLTIRLFANMMSGHTLLKVLLTLAWSASNLTIFGIILPLIFIPILSAVILLETAIGFLQAYVFMVLTSLYFGDVVNAH